MIYAVFIAEGIYQGLHGIEQREIMEVSSLEEAHEIATEISLELMGSYSVVYEELEAEVQDEIDTNDTVNWTEERIEKLRAEIYNENVYYDLYELDDEKIKDKTYEDLEEELYNDFENSDFKEFLDKYQKNET